MADTEKTISFRAKDESSSTIDRLKRSAQELGKGIIADALMQAKTTKEVNRLIEEQIRLIERRGRLDIAQQKMNVTERFQERWRTGNLGDREVAKIEHKRGMGKIEGEKTEQDVQIKLLRELIDTMKEGFRSETTEEKKTRDETIRNVDKSKVNIDDLSEEERYRILQQKERKGGEVGREKGGSWFKSIVGGAIGGAIVSAIDVGGQLAQAKSGDYAVAQALGFISVLGRVPSALQQRHLEELERQQQGRGRVLGVTGRGVYVPGAANYGINQGEAMGFAGDVARTYGSRENLGERTGNILALEKAFGIDRGTLMQTAGFQRFGGGGAMDTVKGLVNEMRRNGMMGEGDDMSRLLELTKFSNTLSQDQLTRLTSIDSSSNAQVAVIAQKIGGVFAADPRLLMQAQQGLVSPKNEWQQARSFAALSRMSPTGDIVDIMKMQERGFATPGYMYETLKGWKAKGRLGIVGAAQQFGLGTEQAEQLLANTEQWRGLGGAEAEKKFKDITSGQIKAKAETYTPEQERRAAEMADAYAKGVRSGVVEMTKQITEAIGGNTWIANKILGLLQLAQKNLSKD